MVRLRTGTVKVLHYRRKTINEPESYGGGTPPAANLEEQAEDLLDFERRDIDAAGFDHLL